jgi:predicted secreted acid phosphatase
MIAVASRDSRMTTGRRQFRSRLVAGIAALMVALLFGGNAMAEPINLGDLKHQALAYHENGYQQDLQAVGLAAQSWLKWRAPFAIKPALVLDIDETSVSNWPEIKANDFGHIVNGPCRLPTGPCGALAWDRMAKAPVIRPTLDLFKLARSLDVSVFFITGRRELERAATELDLLTAGYVDEHGRKGWTELIMEPNGSNPHSAADFKAPERAKIEADGYDIIANVGDQPSDLEGGYAERTFKLPNPFYRVP